MNPSIQPNEKYFDQQLNLIHAKCKTPFKNEPEADGMIPQLSHTRGEQNSQDIEHTKNQKKESFSTDKQ